MMISLAPLMYINGFFINNAETDYNPFCVVYMLYC